MLKKHRLNQPGRISPKETALKTDRLIVSKRGGSSALSFSSGAEMSGPSKIILSLFNNGFYAVVLVFLIACNKTGSHSTEAKNEFLLKAKRTEGKLLAINVRTSMKLYQVDNNKFPPYEKLKEIIEKSQKEEGGSVPLYYNFGTAESHPEVATACPDCKISDDAFKIAIFGNLDDDNDLDIMYINNTEVDVLQLKDDI